MTTRAFLHLSLAAVLLATSASAQESPAPVDPLADGFRNPPQSARPRVWWHWLNGNITEEGITRDLEWMRRVGIGGVQTFDAALGTPQVVAQRLAFMTPPWKHAFAHAVTTASRLGLEFAIASSPGWSETGGPWVPAHDAMKKLVWSQTDLVGGERFTGRLAPPPGTTGPFLDLPFKDEQPGAKTPATPKPSFYAEVAVLAFPVDAAEAMPIASDGNGKPLDAAALVDASPLTAIDLPKGSKQAPGRAILHFSTPRTIRSATVFIADAASTFAEAEYRPVIEAEIDGIWRKLADVPLTKVPTTVAFAAVTTRAVRLTLAPNGAASNAGMGGGAPGAVMVDIFPHAAPSSTVRLGTFSVTAAPRIDRAEAKAGFDTTLDYYALGEAPAVTGVDPARVIDLTARLRADGTLDWTPPPGRWRILRLGYSLLGTTNHPATTEATGLEVDKYDAAAVRRYLEHYLDLYRDAADSDALGKGLGALLTDSIEAGAANWTPAMVAHFKRLRGYDPTPWLPALTGVVIGSSARTDAFLYDYRRTLADLLADAHYGTVAKVAHEHGLIVYGEALEDKRPMLGDDMAMRAHTDIPMAAMWTYGAEGPRPTLIGDNRGAASVAHIYGQNLVAAESMTAVFSPWAFAPADLRPMLDLEFANGINRPVIHTSVHQPLDAVPGLSLAVIGQYFNRHESWAEMAGPWVDYISRTSFLLQQGRNVADLVYFYGEEAPITALNAHSPLADVPPGWGWDYINADALGDAVHVEHSEIVATGGARYRLLYLGGTSYRMTLPTLRRIAALVGAGATLVGRRPSGSPSLADDPQAFAALVHHLWSGGRETRIGAGRVIAADSVMAGLEAVEVAPDFHYDGRRDAEIAFVHRRTPDADIYWIDNRRDRAEQGKASFRVRGAVPELWHADTGETEAVSWRRSGDRTIVTLPLAAQESAFVLFRKPTSASGATVPAVTEQRIAAFPQPWSVAFQPGRGAPPATTMPVLHPLEDDADSGIRYFSGIARYTNAFDLAARPAGRLVVDLGRLGDVAEVRVNGRYVGTAWHRPYRLDISAAVHPGRNNIDVRVANLWVNRLIGDAQPGARKITFTTLPTYLPDAPLRPSGLIGPVTLLATR